MNINPLENFRSLLKEQNIGYYPLEFDGKSYEFFFKEHNLCLFVVDEKIYNEQTIDKNYFRILRDKFIDAKIELMILYKSHFLMKYDVIVNRLMYKLKNTKIVRIYARECEIYEPPYKECKEFLEKYHFQGNVMSKYRVGLKYKDELVALCVYGVPRYNKEFEIEIGRYVVKFGHNIPGNFSKMMSYFIKKYNPKNILTYHDLLFGNNSVYAKCGLKPLEQSPSGFYWYRDDKIYNRRGWWKSTLPAKLPQFDPSISAHANMRKYGRFIKIFEMGQLKFGWYRE